MKPLVQIKVRNGRVEDEQGQTAIISRNVTIKRAAVPMRVYSPFTGGLQFILNNRLLNIDAVEFGNSNSNFSFKLPQTLGGTELFAEVLLKSNHTTASADRINIIESQNPAFSLSLRKVNNTYHIHASISTASGWQNIQETRETIKSGVWYYIGVAFDKGRLSVFINRKLQDSRLVDTETLRTEGDKPTHAGTWIDGSRDQFKGKIGYLNIWNQIPSHIAQIIRPVWQHSTPINSLGIFNYRNMERQLTNITGLDRAKAYFQREEVILRPDLLLNKYFDVKMVLSGDFDGDHQHEILMSPSDDNSKGNDIWALKYDIPTKEWKQIKPSVNHPLGADIDLSKTDHPIRFGVVGDFDGDGTDEVVFAPNASGSLGNDLWARKLNTTTKSWDRLGHITTSKIDASMDVTSKSYSVKFGFCGDLNGDGADELILIPNAPGNQGNDIWIMKYHKTDKRWRHFSPLANHGMDADLDLVNHDRAVRFGVAGDFDGDGKKEIAFAPEFNLTTSNNNCIWVRKFSGNSWTRLGHITSSENFSFKCATNGINYGVKLMLAADIDGDGQDELVVIPAITGNRGNDMWVMKYNKLTKSWNHFSPIPNHNMQADLDLGNFTIDIKDGIAGDFDGDNRDELVFSPNQSGSASNDLWFVKYDVHAKKWVHRSANNRTYNKGIDLSTGRYIAGRLFKGVFSKKGSNSGVELGVNIIHGSISLPDTILRPVVWNDVDLPFIPPIARTEIRPIIRTDLIVTEIDKKVEKSPKAWIVNYGPKKEEYISKRVSGFDPDVNGFLFTNNFPSVNYPIIRYSINLNEINVIGITTPELAIHLRNMGVDTVRFGALNVGDTADGLCGGMVFTTIDFHRYNRLPPVNSTPPTSGALLNYLIDRLFDSFDLPGGVMKYFFLQSNSTDSELREMAVSREWPKVKAMIDNNQLCPVGQIRVKSKNPGLLGKNHQVLVYGYDIEVFTGKVKLYMYDPNHVAGARANRFIEFDTRNFDTMRISLINNVGGLVKDTPNLRGFFVKNYSPKNPGRISV